MSKDLQSREKELVERLRTTAGNPAICKKAADTLEAQAVRIKELEQERDEALRSEAEYITSSAQCEVELAKARVTLERIASPGTVAGMHEQDRAEKLQGIASAAARMAEERKLTNATVSGACEREVSTTSEPRLVQPGALNQ